MAVDLDAAETMQAGLLAYAVFATVLTYAVFRRDMRLARWGAARVPAAALLGLVALGGTLGAKAAQWRFHRVAEGRGFRYGLNLIVAAQLFGAASLVMPPSEMAARIRAHVPETIRIAAPPNIGAAVFVAMDERDPTRAEGIRTIRRTASGPVSDAMPRRFGPGSGD